MQGTGKLRINPLTGNYTRAKENRYRASPLSWQMERILRALRFALGPLTLNQIRDRAELLYNPTHLLQALERRGHVRERAGKWEISRKDEG